MGARCAMSGSAQSVELRQPIRATASYSSGVSGTAILSCLSDPDHKPAAEPVPLELYQQLRGMAHRLMQGETVQHTLQTTALVHEAWIRLMRTDPALVESPRRVLAAAGDAMRNALIDHARGRDRQKRGGDRRRDWVDLRDLPSLLEAHPDQIVALDEAFERLQKEDPLASEVVRLRFHLGMDVESTAQVLDVSSRTVKRRWAFARTWLYHELG